MRDDDWQTAFERLFAVVVVWSVRGKRGDLVADGLDFGTVDELVPDFGCTYLRYTGIYFVCLDIGTYYVMFNVECLMFNDFIAHKFAIHRRYFTLDDFREFHLPLPRVHSQPTA